MITKTKFYYAIEIHYIDNFLTGWKDVSVYRIDNNNPTLIFNKTIELNTIARDFINEELMTLGFRPELFTLTRL